MPDLESQRSRLDRRRRLAEALMQQGPRTEGRMVGRIFVAPSPLEQLAGLGSQLTGAFMSRRLDREEAELNEQERQRVADALNRLSGIGIDESGATGAKPLPQIQAARDAFDLLPTDVQRQVLGGEALKRLFPPAPQQVDLGDAIALMDQSGNVVRRITKGVSPDTRFREEGEMTRHQTPSGNALLSAETTMRGQDLTHQTTLRGQDVTMRGQDLQAQLEREKLAAEQEKQRAALEKRAQGQVSAIDNALRSVDDALKLTSAFSAGLIGEGIRRYGIAGGAGTDAYDLQRTVETIQANLSFRELQRMREESPTGGALGQITERELDLLGATVANLDPGQRPERLVQQLQQVKQHLENLKALQLAAVGLKLQQQQSGGAFNEIDSLMQQYGVPQ